MARASQSIVSKITYIAGDIKTEGVCTYHGINNAGKKGFVICVATTPNANSVQYTEFVTGTDNSAFMKVLALSRKLIE